MMRLLLPLLFALIGLGAGIGAALALRPAPEPEAALMPNPCGPEAAAPPPAPDATPAEPDPTTEFVKLPNQFVVPVVEDGAVVSLVVMSLSVEVPRGEGDAVLAREPRLRDGFLRVLLDHANSGGFRGAFTANGTMDRLRGALLETARRELGELARNVLILDINRQDMD